MPDGVLTVGTRINNAPLISGLAEAQAAVQNAMSNMASVHAAFGKAAAEGSAQAAAVLKQYQLELDAAQARLASFTAATTQATTATRGLTSVAALAGREIGGGMGGALGRVVAQTGLLGDSIQALMPAFIGLAAVDVFGHLAQQAVEAYDKFVSLSAIDEKLFDDVRKMQAQDFVNVHSLEVAQERLKDVTVYASNLRDISNDLQSSGWKEILSGNITAGVANLFAGGAARNQSSEDQKRGISLQKDTLELKHQQALLAIEAAHSTDGELQGQAKINAELQKKLATNKENADYSRLRDREMGNPVSSNAAESERALKDAAARGEAQAQSFELARKAQADLISETVKGDQEQVESGKRVTEALTKSWVTMYDSDLKGMKEQAEQHETDTRAWVDQENERLAAERAVLEERERSAGRTYESTERTITFNEKLNRVSPQDATQQRLGAVNQEESTQTSAQQGVIASTKQQYGDQSPQYQAAQDKLVEIQQKASQQRQQIVQNEQLREQQIYQQGFNTIDAGLNNTMNAWLQGTERMSRAWTQFGDNIAVSVIDGLARAAAAEVVSLATSDAVNADKRLDDAKTAAANSYAWASSWGGPLAGAVAAAVAFSAVASFDQGTSLVPRDGIAMLHRGESVLPPPQTEELRAALGRGRNGGGTENHFHYSPNVSGIDGPSIAAHLNSSGQEYRRWVDRQMRLANIKQ